MSFSGRIRFTLIVGIAAFALFGGRVYTQNAEQGAQGRGGQGRGGGQARGPAAPVPNADILDPARNPLPNPNPTVVKGFGVLPDGRMWGSTAGVAVGPDQNVWAYDRCGTNTCEDSNLTPIFKFDRTSGKVLASFGAGMFVFPHGLYVSESNETRHPGWKTGVRIGNTKEDKVVAFIVPHDNSKFEGAAGEGIAVDRDGNVYGAEGPISRPFAGGGLTKYVKK